MAKTLRVIDISSNNGDVKQGKIDYDAVIIKATEGKTYINPYCDSEFQEAYKLGKKLGVYHFARNTNNSATDEANFFIKQTKGYIGKAIPVLDWEDKDTSDVAWALKWLQHVEKAYGCKPMIYMSESVVNRYDWSKVASGNYGLWCAKYRDYVADYDWDMASAGAAPSVKYWKTIALWQWTSVGRLDGHSGNLDCSIFYGDEAAWDKYVGKGESGQTSSSSSSTSKPSKSTSKADQLTVDGKWGKKTTKRLQQIFGTTVDGKVSNQFSAYKSDNPGLLSETFEWESNPSGYSPLIKAIQKKVGATQDGHIGPKTIKAMQKWLGTTQDGKVSAVSPMVKALQKWCNKQDA